MTEWIEQPEFEKNEFKKGDKVRVYDGNTVTDGVVTVLDWRPEFKDFLASTAGGQDWFHFKQCRLLKKREVREFWINSLKGDYEYFRAYEPTDDENLKTCGWIKVREVLEEK